MKKHLLKRIAVFLFFGTLLPSCKDYKELSEKNKAKCNIKEKTYSINSVRSLTEYVDSLSVYKLRKQHYCYTIIDHANVLDVESGSVKSDQCVVLTDNIIADIIPSPEKIPRKYRKRCLQYIDATGKFLAPGLCNMHVHYQCTRDRLYALLFGVTTIRNTGVNHKIRGEQRLLTENSIVGPNLYTTTVDVSTLHSSGLVLTDTAFQESDWILAAFNLNKDTLAKIKRYVLEHRLKMSVENYYSVPVFDYPEGTVFEKWTNIVELENSPGFSGWWFLSRFSIEGENGGMISGQPNAAGMTTYEVFIRNHRNQICIGTERLEWPPSLIVNATMLEMKYLSARGFSNDDIIRIATINAGKMAGIRPLSGQLNLNTDNLNYLSLNFGEIKQGYRADILLLDGNPLESIVNYEKIHAVFVNGVYLSPEELSEIKEILKSMDHAE